MLDIRWMRENRAALAEAMQKLNDPNAPWEEALRLDEERRELLTKVEVLRAERNSGSKQIGLLFREKKTEEANALKQRMSDVGDEIAAIDAKLNEIEPAFEDAMLQIPQPARARCASGIG